MPGLNGVVAGWDFVDFEIAHRVTDREVWICNDPNIRIHPIVNVAFEMQHDFFVFRFEFVNQAGPGLSDIKGIILARQPLHVVQKGIAILDLDRLADAGTDDARRVYAPLLVNRDWLIGRRNCGEITQHSNENVCKTTVDGCDNVLLYDSLAGIYLRAHRIHTHPYDRIARQISHEANMPLYRTCTLAKRGAGH